MWMAIWTHEKVEMTPLTEEEIMEKYEKVCLDDPGEVPCKNGEIHDGIKTLDQAGAFLRLPDCTRSEGIRLRKTEGAGGALESYDSDQEDSEDSEDDKTVDAKYGDKEDFQRPSKLDLIVGFLRFSNFLSCATAVSGVAVSIFYSLSEPLSNWVVSANLSTVYNIWSLNTLSPFHQYSRQVRVVQYF